ncbi:MAG: hypothetical protein RLZZ144_654 [Pseudomonadota bacterium]|jgi:preprotein translocase subunit YajC
MISVSDLLISSAHAADAGAPSMQDSVMQYLPLIALVAVFYFMILRPQQKRAKEHKALIDALQKGDEIVTIGGELGKVVKVDENYVQVEIAANVVVTIQRAAVQTTLPKGTIKSI